MSVLLYRERKKAKDVQIWNNAAFDNGESEDSSAIRPCLSPIKSIFINPSESFDSFSSKENQIPVLAETSSSVFSVKTPRPLEKIKPNVVVKNSKVKSSNAHFKNGFVEKEILQCVEARVEMGIDKEIEEIEMEISRLTSRLEALRLEKAEKNTKTVEKSGKVVPAKFMEQKQSGNNAEESRKIEENLSASARTKVNRRGLSLGPAEIVAGLRRGTSLGPAEIVSSNKSQQLRKQEMLTPVQPIQNRQKSCFWKLQGTNEEKVTKERGKCLSPSLKLREGIKKNEFMRQAVTTIGSKKPLKKYDVMLNSVQPTKLFKDGEKSLIVLNKKPLRQGRVVTSRYNQWSDQASMRKRSLPQNDKDVSKTCDKKSSSFVGKTRVTVTENKSAGVTVSRMKKHWEIPNQIVVHGTCEDQKSPQSVSVMYNLLPRVTIAWRMKESPRDSGPAKRVAELVGRKSFFSTDEELEPSVCQELNFAEEDTEE